MLNIIKKYWAEILTFSAIFTTLMVCCTPDITWINTDCDGPHYIYSAKYLYPAHKTSAPLFLLLGNLFIRIPFGTDAWNFAFLSVIATTITCLFIYLSAKHHTNSKYYSLIGTLIYGGSALVISQSTIIESYALVTMFGIGAYYFSLKKRWLLVTLMLGAGGAVHHLIMIPMAVIFFANKDFRRWKYIGIMSLFLLFYLYIPITNRPPYMWQSPNSELSMAFLIDNLSTMGMLWGGISIWDLPKRLIETGLLILITFTIGLIPLIKGIDKIKNQLFWLFILPVIYYATNLAPQTYVYLIGSIAIGGILIAIGLQKLEKNNKIRISYAVIGLALAALIFNGNYFNIGVSLDPELSARKFWNEIDQIPNGQILMAQQGWEWAMVYPYNKEENRDIIPVCNATLPSIMYCQTLEEMGVNLDYPPDGLTMIEKQKFVMNSIVEQNENIWTTFVTNSAVYESIVEPMNEENYEIMMAGLTIPDNVFEWKFKPDSPYSIITGAIEIDNWVFIVQSNYSVLTFFMLGCIGFIPILIIIKFIKRKKWSVGNIKERIKEV